ncbi:putative effector of murein hydrolase LrgB [alpha proteobacterium BAL199]|jgi:predicted murein hydrolase (TIGR00659 family)|nr:putative effector of murein hydrolase LrgB [alpha proteobacterium BAL199]
MKPIDELWVYLATNPLLHLTLTLVAYLIGNRLYRRFGMNPLLNPVMIAIVILVGLLVATGTSYGQYFEGAQFVHFLLGPATVALAVPLYNQFARVRRSVGPLLAAIIMGSLSASLSAVGIAVLLGAAPEIVASIAPKSVTTPIAMGIAEQLGGLPSLTAVLVILTGVVGAMLGPPLLTLLRIRDWRARGLAIGVAAHGIGTARAMQVNEVAGAFSGLAMGLNALATAILLPLLWSWIF